MTPPLASDRPQTLQAATIGGAWLAVARLILADGIASRYDERPVREISLVTLVVDRPDPDDEIIARYAEPERLAWMHANFTDHARVPALRHVAGQLRRPAGRLIMIVKSAHIYQTERGYVLGVLADAGAAAGSGQPPDGDGQRGEL